MDNHAMIQPHRPTHMPDHATTCLQALAEAGLGDRISIGGALGLLHYLDYRSTHDVDAWWVQSATAQEQERVVNAIETALQPFGRVRRRAWGDVISIELVSGEQTTFSFQIAHRSVQLQLSAPAPWTDVLLDSFPDLVAGKMVALVERGAPRDFRDIYTLCQAGLTTPAQCWRLWQERQRLANSDVDLARARLAVQTHLARIALHRPLDKIADSAERVAAERVRTWFLTEFPNAFVD